MKKDTIFAEQTQAIGDFNFGEKTAAVFEDMLERSIPLYRELRRMLDEIAAEFAVSGTHVYDLGCSDGITLATLSSAIADAGKQVRLVGVDYSAAMLDKVLCLAGLVFRDDYVNSGADTLRARSGVRRTVDRALPARLRSEEDAPAR